MDGTEPAIEIERLEFGWPGSPPLIAIDKLTIDRGERVFLKGPSGSGKSTLLGLIAGIVNLKTGSIRVNGATISKLRPSERDRFRSNHIGFIFQLFNLIPYLTVRSNVLLPLHFSPERRERLNDVELDDEVVRLLTALGLAGGNLLERLTTQLSIGQQQRVAAARALIGRPDIVIADEPTSSLDADTRAGFLRLLMAECRTLGTTLVFVSHDSSLETFFDRTLSMSDLMPNAPAQ